MNSSRLLFAVVALYLFCFLSYGQRVKTDQIFKTVTIGNQVWMAENLNVDHYRNGDPIPHVQDPEEWIELTTGAWCYYNNDPANGEIYGKLYNWYAVNDSRGLVPEGWHVPTDEEWQTLVDYLGGDYVAGGKLKETGTAHWHSPNTGATNEGGFTALPGGARDGGDGTFLGMGGGAGFWSASEYYSSHAWGRSRGWGTSGVQRDYYLERHGFSVRLVRD